MKNKIIVPADKPIFLEHIYTEIQGGTLGCSAIINGTSVTLAPSSSINVWVRSISGGEGCFLLGDINKKQYEE